MTKTLPELVKAFYDRDPILGEEASQELVKSWKDDAIKPLSQSPPSHLEGVPPSGPSRSKYV